MRNNSWMYYEILIMILEKKVQSNIHVVHQSVVAVFRLLSFASGFIFIFFFLEIDRNRYTSPQNEKCLYSIKLKQNHTIMNLKTIPD